MARTPRTVPTPTGSPNAGVTQSVSVTIRVAGDQDIVIDTHGTRAEQPAYIAVSAPGLAVYLYDPIAAATYADAFTDLAVSPLLAHVPETIGEVTAAERHAADDSPAVVIRAHGHDRVRQFPVTEDRDGRPAIGIRVGRVTWLMQDLAALRAYTKAWRQVHNLIPLVLGAPRDHRNFA